MQAGARLQVAARLARVADALQLSANQSQGTTIVVPEAVAATLLKLDQTQRVATPAAQAPRGALALEPSPAVSTPSIWADVATMDKAAFAAACGRAAEQVGLEGVPGSDTSQAQDLSVLPYSPQDLSGMWNKVRRLAARHVLLAPCSCIAGVLSTVHEELPRLAADLLQDRQRSDSMEGACDAAQLRGLMRHAIKVLKGLQITLTHEAFQFAVVSVVPILKIIERCVECSLQTFLAQGDCFDVLLMRWWSVLCKRRALWLWRQCMAVQCAILSAVLP